MRNPFLLAGCALGAALLVAGTAQAQSGDAAPEALFSPNFPVNDVTAYRVAGTTAFAISNANVMADFADLTVTFTLAAPSPAMIVYNIASESGGAGFLVTTVAVDGVEVATLRTISNATNPAPYFNNGATSGTFLSAGMHTVTVRYRSNVGGMNQPAANDYNTRHLMVIVVS